jgi:hypothetical protein
MVVMDVCLFERFYRGFLVSRDKYTRGVGRNYDVECGVVSKLLPMGAVRVISTVAVEWSILVGGFWILGVGKSFWTWPDFENSSQQDTRRKFRRAPLRF